jgi:CheY-like chemotaxis protein
MLDNQPKKTLTIFDPYTSNGNLLAQKFLNSGCKVLLLGDKTNSQLEHISTSKDLNSDFIFLDVLDSCIDNLRALGTIRQSENLIVIKSLAGTKCFFDLSYDFKNEIVISELKKQLILLAEKNEIPIIQHNLWQCSGEILDGVITKILEFIVDENNRKMYVNTLQADLFLMEKLSYVELLEKCIRYSSEVLWTELHASQISIRDLFRLVLDELGAEIEFCGKGEQERGVIIDYEDDILSLYNVDRSKIRLGNTIVKINEANYNKISAVSKFESKRDNHTSLSNINSLLIKRLIKSKICKYLN